MSPQWEDALAKANRNRFARAELKRHIAAGDVLAGEVLLSSIPDWLSNMSIEELVMSAPRFFRKIFVRAMEDTNTHLTATLGGLTARKRRELGEMILETEERRLDRKRRKAAA